MTRPSGWSERTTRPRTRSISSKCGRPTRSIQKSIDRELGWAEDLGFTSMRVFLHHQLWEQDQAGFLKRMDQLLAIADKHDIGIMFVLFDSVWDPHPKLGKQRDTSEGAPQLGLGAEPRCRRPAQPRSPCPA